MNKQFPLLSEWKEGGIVRSGTSKKEAAEL
jgi:hypothetical protein